ncbi:MAG: CAAD domain-containing protein [Microcoleaceae cyanobacterium]
MATNKNKKSDNTPDSSAKTPTTESNTTPATPKAESEPTKTASTAETSKPTIDPVEAKSATAQKVSSTEAAKVSPDKSSEPEAKSAAPTKPTEKLSEPIVKPAAAQASQPPAPAAQSKPPEPETVKPSQPAFTPPATPAKSVVAPPPDSPVSATVSSSQPTIVEPDVEVYSTDSTDTTFEEIKAKVVTFLENLPENTANFFKQNQKPLISLGLILAVLITIKITAGLLDILNEIPLVKPLFEAVGVTYSGWFIYRYLLWSNNRQELWQKVDTAKEDILGGNKEVN